MTSGSASRSTASENLLRIVLIVGVAGAIFSLIGAFFDSRQFFRSYLFAYIFWFAIPLGSLGILMLHHLVGGEWGWVIQRPLEAATQTLLLIAPLFLPLLLGLDVLYPWAQPEAGADPLLLHKSAYLNVPFYIGRSIFYLALWGGMAYFLNRWSREQDDSTEPFPGRRMRRLSGPGLAVYVLSMTFASVDWIMSIEPLWYSTIYGMLWVVNQGVAALAFAIVGLKYVEGREPLSRLLRPDHFHDLGNLLLAFIMLWAYLSFSQYLIIWSGNLVEEVPWYLHRTKGHWQWIPPLLITFHFFVPFMLLLMTDLKRRSGLLAGIAIGILFMRLIDTFWLIAPGFEESAIHWMDLTLIAGIGGLWLGFFLWRLERGPLLPRRAPLAVAERTAHA